MSLLQALDQLGRQARSQRSARERAEAVARERVSTVWVPASDLDGAEVDPDFPESGWENGWGAYALCDCCDGSSPPNAVELSAARSAEFRRVLVERGIQDGEVIPPDLLALDDAPEGFDDWPDALSIEHIDGCPIGLLLDLTKPLTSTAPGDQGTLCLGCGNIPIWVGEPPACETCGMTLEDNVCSCSGEDTGHLMACDEHDCPGCKFLCQAHPGDAPPGWDAFVAGLDAEERDALEHEALEELDEERGASR